MKGVFKIEKLIIVGIFIFILAVVMLLYLYFLRLRKIKYMRKHYNNHFGRTVIASNKLQDYNTDTLVRLIQNQYEYENKASVEDIEDIIKNKEIADIDGVTAAECIEYIKHIDDSIEVLKEEMRKSEYIDIKYKLFDINTNINVYLGLFASTIVSITFILLDSDYKNINESLKLLLIVIPLIISLKYYHNSRTKALFYETCLFVLDKYYP